MFWYGLLLVDDGGSVVPSTTEMLPFNFCYDLVECLNVFSLGFYLLLCGCVHVGMCVFVRLFVPEVSVCYLHCTYPFCIILRFFRFMHSHVVIYISVSRRFSYTNIVKIITGILLWHLGGA